MNQNQIAYWNYKENVRNNQAVLAETIRHNKAMEESGLISANAAYLNAYTTSSYAKQYADAASMGASASMLSANAQWLRAQTESEYASVYANASSMNATSGAIGAFANVYNAVTNRQNAHVNYQNAETNAYNAQTNRANTYIDVWKFTTQSGRDFAKQIMQFTP